MTRRTVQITIDDDLLQVVDKTVSEMDTSRSAFIRQALQITLKRIQVLRLEQQHAAGYALHPAAPDEFDESLALLTSPRPVVS
ncbi:MAG: ribbon-helix-helix protein, CopG family [Chloroflexi bacterium]|nr:ribbon-helix-helix protein, CopG family [Chloroflexota bacterium]